MDESIIGVEATVEETDSLIKENDKSKISKKTPGNLGHYEKNQS